MSFFDWLFFGDPLRGAKARAELDIAISRSRNSPSARKQRMYARWKSGEITEEKFKEFCTNLRRDARHRRRIS